jgi:hypothetical protein
MNGHKYQWKDIIVGYNLSALIYAFYTGMPVAGYTSSMPWHFEKIAPSASLPDYGMGQGVIKTQIELWHHLYMLLSMGGQLPFADNAASIRIGDGSLSVSTDNRSRIVEAEYETLWVFDDREIEGLPPITEACDLYRVCDWFNVRSGMRHDENMLLTPTDDFIRTIHFYPSERLDGHHPDKKDLCAESFLSEEELDKFEYSPTYARFKVLSMMKDLGIRGSSNGNCPKTGKKKHYAIKIEHDRREKKRVAMHTYDTPAQDKIIFNRITPAALLCEIRGRALPAPANPYIPKVLLTS